MEARWILTFQTLLPETMSLAHGLGGLLGGLAMSSVRELSREGMDGHVVGLSAHSVPGWVLDKQDVPKGSSGFSILFHDPYAMRITWGCQGRAIRASAIDKL